MHTIKIDVSDNIYDNVMFFLNNLPKKDIKLYTKKDEKKEETLEKELDELFSHSNNRIKVTMDLATNIDEMVDNGLF